MSDKETITQLRNRLAQMQTDQNLAQRGHLAAAQEVIDLRDEKDNLLNRYTDDMDAVHLALDIDVAELDEHPWAAVEAIRELRSNLALAQFQLADACAARDALARERDDVKREAKYYVEQLRAESAQAREELVTADAAMDAVQALWRSPAEAKRQDANLAEARAELKDLQEANWEYRRDYWYKTALKAEAERDEIRKEAQAQSDLVQHEWLRLEQKLAKTEAQVASCLKATRWLWGYYDGNTLVAKPGYEDDIREAWDDLLIAMSTRATSKLLERLAILDAAEKALEGCGIGGIFAGFDGLPDAINQMAQHIKELTQEPVEIEMTDAEIGEALQTEVRKRVTAETDAHTLSKALDECTQTVHTERARRRDMERCARQVEAELKRAHQTLYHLGVPSDDENGKLPITERIERLARHERARRATRAEALAATLAEVHAMLSCSPQHPWRGCEAQSYHDRAHYMCHSQEARELLKKALEGEMPTNTQALLAQLVTPGLANLLVWLAIDIEILREHFVDTFDNDDRRDAKVATARKLAAQIREALDDSQA